MVGCCRLREAWKGLLALTWPNSGLGRPTFYRRNGLLKLDETHKLRSENALGVSDEQTALLLRMSASSIERRLANERRKTVLRGRSHTKPGSLLKSQIPVRTWTQWDDAVPGFVEIDLVGHEGGHSHGEFCFTLTVTDISTGWTVNRSVRNKAQKHVFATLMHIREVFEFLTEPVGTIV